MRVTTGTTLARYYYGQDSSGHGLGLTIARRAAERHGGRLELSNASDGGFSACLQLPLAEAH